VLESGTASYTGGPLEIDAGSKTATVYRLAAIKGSTATCWAQFIPPTILRR
jgi:hypothetical protein